MDCSAHSSWNNNNYTGEQKMRIESVVIGILLFSTFVVGGALILSNLYDNYDITEDTSLFNGTNESSRNANSQFDFIQNMTNITERYQNKMTPEGGITPVTGIDMAFANAVATFGFVRVSFQYLGMIIEQVAMTLHIPTFIVVVISSMFTITLIFTIIYMIIRFKPQRD